MIIEACAERSRSKRVLEDTRRDERQKASALKGYQPEGLQFKEEARPVFETTTALHWLAELLREQIFITADDVLSHNSGLSRRTVHQYLNRLAREGELTQVGRGLYRTDSPPPFQPPLPERVRTLAHRIRAQLPFSEFTIWSTVQAIELAHMLPTRHVAFVEADQEVAPAIYEVLLSANEPALLDPPRDALDQLLALSKEPLVVRRRAETMATVEVEGVRTATLEKLLVDLYFESSREGLLLDPGEFGRMLRSALTHYNVNFVLLLAYAERRGIRDDWQALLHRLRTRTSLPVWTDATGGPGRHLRIIEAIIAGACGDHER